MIHVLYIVTNVKMDLALSLRQDLIILYPYWAILSCLEADQSGLIQPEVFPS